MGIKGPQNVQPDVAQRYALVYGKMFFLHAEVWWFSLCELLKPTGKTLTSFDGLRDSAQLTTMKESYATPTHKKYQKISRLGLFFPNKTEKYSQGGFWYLRSLQYVGCHPHPYLRYLHPSKITANCLFLMKWSWHHPWGLSSLILMSFIYSLSLPDAEWIWKITRSCFDWTL